MQITIVEEEIKAAIESYVRKNVNLEGKYLEIDMVAGRGSTGFTATMDVVADTAKEAVIQVDPDTPETDETTTMGISDNPEDDVTTDDDEIVFP